MDATKKAACIPNIDKNGNAELIIIDQNVIELDDLEEPGSSKATFNDVRKEQPSTLTDTEILLNILKTLTPAVKETLVTVSETPKKGDIEKSGFADAVNQEKSNANSFDFIINLDDSLDIEEETEKNDPLACSEETGAEIVANISENEKNTKNSCLSNESEMADISTNEAVENEDRSTQSKIISNSENVVICIDTDDEDEKKNESITNKDVIMQSDEPSKETNSLELTVTDISARPAINSKAESRIENKKRNSNELSSPCQEIDTQTSNGPPLKIPRLPKLLECVNIECPRDYDSTYTTASKFILHYFFVPSKSNKEQFVCNSCTEKAVEKFEMISGALFQGLPICDIELPKHAELVEIIDSDEEGDTQNNDEVLAVDDTMKIDWDQDVMHDFESIVKKYSGKINFKHQADCEDSRLKIKEEQQEQSMMDLDVKLKALEKQTSKMYNNLYSVNRPKIERRDSVSFTDELEGQQCQSPDIVSTLWESLKPVAQYPPARNAKNNRTIVQNNVQDSDVCDIIQKKGSFSYAVRSKTSDNKSNWAKCKLLEVITTFDHGVTKKKYRVQFLDNLPNSIAIVSGFEISFSQPSEDLSEGTRVIAVFNRSKPTESTDILGYKKYLPGVIREKLSDHNKRRYLVFCDYGHWRYIPADFVLKVIEQSEDEVPHVHPNISVRRGQRVPVELNGSWRNAVVVDIDCSIIKVHFPLENADEWIFRGSRRLGPVKIQATRSPLNFRKRKGQSGPYITVGDGEESNEDDNLSIASNGPKSVAKKSTAKKSTQPVNLTRSSSSTSQGASAPPTSSDLAVQKVHILNDDKIYIDEPPQVSMLRKFTPRKDITARKYVFHTCGRQCFMGPKPSLSGYSPLTKPLLACWERQLVKFKTHKHVVYKAPCGRRLRNMNEVHIYLKCTKNRFNVDNFDFDPTITVLSFYDIDKKSCGLYIDDLADGKEGMPIPVVNAFDDQRPPDMQYSSVRIPTKNVRIDKDPGFLMCCDCTDDCADKSKCACFQNTIAGAKFRNIMDLPEEDISYKYKRLHNMVQTGIYECNQRCKCNDRCFNRVVQKPIQIKMQLYRTKNRGWGLECCHDIPKGTFICTYVGYLYPEKEANALCANESHGDEYFAELDYIENVQGLKEGYEAGVQFDDTDDDDDDEKNSDSDSDYNEQVDQQDDDFITNAAAASKRAIATRSSTQIRPKRSGSGKQGEQTEGQMEDDGTSGTRQSDSSSDDEDQSLPKKDLIDLISDDEIIVTVPESRKEKLPPVKIVTKSIRKMFGPKERVYILDAKQCGNVGRYFNHSCQPNLFVQSVFVDSHDPRFPWVSFFASRTIKAGEELTWNYNYDVGSVPGKVLYCKCGSRNCRTRIL